MLLCGIVLLISGHHHEHDHGVSKWLQNADSRSSWLWSFLLGVFFAVAFCPHRLIYFITMIDLAVAMPMSISWLMLIVFGLGTGLPIMIAWLISYSAVSIGSLTHRLEVFEKWFRYICAGLFIALGIYLAIHTYTEQGEHHQCTTYNEQRIANHS